MCFIAVSQYHPNPIDCMRFDQRRDTYCQGCRHKSSGNIESNTFLMLEVPDAPEISMLQLLKNCFSYTSMRTCPHCLAINQVVEHQLSIIHPPEILNACINWVHNHRKGSTLRRKFTDYQKIKIYVGRNCFQYQAFCIIFRGALCSASGHYTCIVIGSGCSSVESCSGMIRSAKCWKSGWRHYNDKVVSIPMSFTEAVRAAMNSPSAPSVNGCPVIDTASGHAPYIICYTRVQDRDWQSSAPCCSMCSFGDSWRDEWATRQVQAARGEEEQEAESARMDER
jgi:hypothetical protein